MKRALGISLAVLLPLVVVSGFLALTLRPPADDEARRARILSLAEAGVENGDWPGIAWAEVAPGRIVSLGAAGFADIASGRTMTPDTTMPIGSISKVMVGLAAAEAIRSGALDANAPLADYLHVRVDAPDGLPRTFGQLATHTAGIRDSEAGYDAAVYHYGSTTHPVPLAAFLASYLSVGGRLYDAQANFAPWPPGSRYEYSNVGAGLAAQAIADSTGEDFAAYSRRVLAPLGFSGGWGQLGPVPEIGATLYARDTSGNFEPLPPYGLATWPDGQFNASARDLARLLAVVMGAGRFEGAPILDPETVALLTTPRATGFEGFEHPTDSVGLFWTRETLSFGPYRLDGEGHNGGDPGVFTMMYRIVGTDVGFVVMMNGMPEGNLGLFRLVRIVNLLANMPTAQVR
ncbi:MAG: beta-lactamase family protein [Maritimibacter sp.]|nr:beta-lactamase family protein [Maritimibacter sp.]